MISFHSVLSFGSIDRTPRDRDSKLTVLTLKHPRCFTFCVLEQDMRTIFVWGCLLAVLIEPCMSDMYMHFPPGSNNRLNGNQDNVRNADRMFDSQVGRHFFNSMIHSCSLFQAGQDLVL